jgi:diketogulonate reductase-like aldo/keto reductase
MTSIPRLGLGTWQMGDYRSQRDDEIAALRTGLDLGFPMIDTAELYGTGIAETLVGEAIAGRRDAVYLVSKVLPQNASRAGVVAACERSLRRLRTDRLDLYLLHWAGDHPIAETVAGFDRLVESGKIARWGVSNFDVHELDEMAGVAGGAKCASNQVYYNLAHRGVERRVAPWCRARGVVVQAYTPLDQGRLATSSAVKRVAARHGVSASAVAFAWSARDAGASSVAKSSRPDRVRELAAALTLTLTDDDLRELDAAFPRPTRDGPLETV